MIPFVNNQIAKIIVPDIITTPPTIPPINMPTILVGFTGDAKAVTVVVVPPLVLLRSVVGFWGGVGGVN